MLNKTLVINTVNIIPQNYALGFGRRYLKSGYVNPPQTSENLGFPAFFGKSYSFSLTCLPT